MPLLTFLLQLQRQFILTAIEVKHGRGISPYKNNVYAY